MRVQEIDRSAERSQDEGRYTDPRWGRRFFIGFSLLALLVVGGFYAWTASGRNALARQVAAYRAAGEPIELGDFVVPGVADDDNAAIPLREAAAGIDTKSDAWQAYEKLQAETAVPLTDKEAATIRAIVALNAAAFAKVDTAMARTGVDWKIAYRSPAISILLPDLNHQRQLARLMVERARLNYQQGDHAAAVRDLRRAAFIGRAAGHQPVLVGHLVHVGIIAMTCDALQQMQPGLKVGAGAGEAPPAEVAALIALLLDDKPTRDGFARAMNGERMVQLDTARAVADGRLLLSQLTPGGGPLGAGPNPAATAATFAAKPMTLADGLLMIRHTTALRRAYENARDWPTYVATAPPYPLEVQESRVRHLLAKTLLPSFERATQVDFRHAADRRMTAIALAVRWYAVDHAGAPPASLDELVPKYLPAVPLDPFDADGKPLRYVNDPDKPLIYSLGDDGLDGGGSELAAPQAPRQGAQRNLNRWDRLDAVVHLKPQPREMPTEDPADAEPEIYPNEKAIRAAAQRATTSPATSPAPGL